MLSHPSHKLVPNVILCVPEEHQSFSVKAEPIILDLSDYHLRSPLAHMMGIRGDLDLGNPGAG
jgi:hypothetical protein